MSITLVIIGLIIIFAAWLGLKTLLYLIKTNLATGWGIFKSLFLALIFVIILGALIYLYFHLKASGFII
jgi:hypothetical protein